MSRQPAALATAALALLIAAAVSVPFAGPVAASTPGQGARPWDSAEDGPFPSRMTSFLECTVERIIPPHTVVLLDREEERQYEVAITDSVELRARHKKEFDGRKKLAFTDLAAGQRVKVVYTTADRRIVRIQVLGTEEGR